MPSPMIRVPGMALTLVGLFKARVPAFTLGVPEYVLAGPPHRGSWRIRIWVGQQPPGMAPVNVVGLLLPPTIKMGPRAKVMFPAPAREPMVSLNVSRPRVVPAARVTSLASGM